MRVAIVGSRDFAKLGMVRDYVKELPRGTVVVTGGAPGVDFMAEVVARARLLKCEVYTADWPRHGRAAGPIRNQTIVDVSDRVVAFWDGRSRGTADTITKAREKGIPVEVVTLGPALEE